MVFRSMKKIELIIEQVHITFVLKMLAQLKISGYSLIRDVMGSGDHGFHDCQEISDVNNNCYFIMVVTPSQADSFVENMKGHVKKYGGILLVSDVQVWGS